MAHTLRTIIIFLCLVLLYSGSTTGVSQLQSSPVASSPKQITDQALTSEQRQLVDEAILLFTSGGLTLPPVSIEFPTEPQRCFQNGGIYLPSELTVRICRPSLKTMVHELAHSWVETTLTADEREAFLTLRGLTTWAGGENWGERGAEQAAEIIAWAVMETDISVRWIETNRDGTTSNTTRLFKIANSDHDELITAFSQLTDELPHKRLADQAPIADELGEITSPEARR